MGKGRGSYKKEEVERLALAINDKFNIYIGVLHDRNNQWILTIALGPSQGEGEQKI